MHDLELARLIHAFKIAQHGTEDAFVPPPPAQPSTLAGTLRLMPSGRRSG